MHVLIEVEQQISVGVKAMDNQHITLVSILNELHAAMMKARRKALPIGC